jgi:DNA-directed RNA polymerase sigma subunit (sigma70/sigma32)
MWGYKGCIRECYRKVRIMPKEQWRSDKIFELREEGWGLKRIAKVFNISVERIRQLYEAELRVRKRKASNMIGDLIGGKSEG